MFHLVAVRNHDGGAKHLLPSTCTFQHGIPFYHSLNRCLSKDKEKKKEKEENNNTGSGDSSLPLLLAYRSARIVLSIKENIKVASPLVD